MKEYKQYDRAVYYELAYGKGREHWAKMDAAEVLSLLSAHWSQAPGSHLKLRESALEELLSHYSIPTLQENPLKEGDVLGRIGDSTFPLKRLKELLQPLGIKVVNNINDKTTHVLVGTNPKTTKGLEHHQKTLLSDQLLQAELDRFAQPYLQEKDIQTVSSVQNLAQLLVSTSNDNIFLALELIQGGGFPKALIPEAFLAMKLSSDKKVYELLKDLLDKYLSDAGRKAIRRTLNFSLRMGEVHLAKHLHLFCKNVPDLDATTIALTLYQYHKKGFQYIWQYSSDSALKKKLLEDFIVGNTLTIVGQGISLLPDELADYPQLTTVILNKNRLTTVPPILSKLPNLAYLELSDNKIKGVHSRLLKMEQLRYLGLYEVEYWNTPHLKKMKQLNQLCLRSYTYEPAQDALEEFKKALPNCELVHTRP